MIKEKLQSLVAVILMGIGYGAFKSLNIGLDSFNSVISSLSIFTGIQLGVIQIIINVLIIFIVKDILKEYIGLGTALNIFLLGFIIDFVYIYFSGKIKNSMLTVLFLILIISFSIALYINSDSGIAPYDILVKKIELKSEINYFKARMLLDFFLLTIAMLLKAKIGLGTFILTMFIGPLIGAWQLIFELIKGI